MPLTAQQSLVRSKMDVFRRFSVKRRLDDSSGDYEASWQDLSDEVVRWGSIQWGIDETKYSYFQQAGMSLSVKNDTGLFDHELNQASFWNGYLTRYKTLVKIDCGFSDPDDASDIPPTDGTVVASTSTQFIGLMTEAIKLDGDNKAIINVKSLSSALEEVPSNILVVASAGAADAGQLTASDLMARMRDVTDGSANFILRKFITSTDWNIDSTTQTLTSLDTTTALDGDNCWGLAIKLAEISNKAIWIDKLGSLYFQSKDPTTTVSFILSGVPFNNTTYGHTIKRVTSVYEDINLLFNRVRIKHGEDDVEASYETKVESYSVGDSTTSWKYGVRTLEFENTWLDSTNAEIIASTLFVDLNTLQTKVDLSCKYIPTLNILDRVSIEYDLQTEGGTRWDLFDWDDANWDGSKGPTFLFTGREYKITKITHNLDSMETKTTLREI